MNSRVRITLQVPEPDRQRLQRLQERFALTCNAIALQVQATRCWNRVALHHMVYKSIRQQFPDVGSQMVCNAIYSVCRASRSIYQGRGSPFHVQRLAGRPLPLLAFQPGAPVYFDRHTLSIKDGKASLFTLDGRIRFDIGLSPEQEARFKNDRLRELMLHKPGPDYVLDFVFATLAADNDAPEAEADVEPDAADDDPLWPDFVIVQDHPIAPPDVGALAAHQPVPSPSTRPAA